MYYSTSQWLLLKFYSSYQFFRLFEFLCLAAICCLAVAFSMTMKNLQIINLIMAGSQLGLPSSVFNLVIYSAIVKCQHACKGTHTIRVSALNFITIWLTITTAISQDCICIVSMQLGSLL